MAVVMTPEERYERDVMFRRVVNELERLVVQAQLTPSEIREAAMLACIHHEMRSSRVVQTGSVSMTIDPEVARRFAEDGEWP